MPHGFAPKCRFERRMCAVIDPSPLAACGRICAAPFNPCRSVPVLASDRMRSSPRWVPAAWARCIACGIHGCSATSRSKSFQICLRVILNGSGASSARRGSQPPPQGAHQLYNVRMKRYTSSQVRERLSSVLDAAERGEPVVIERRGVRFALRAEGVARPTRRPRRPVIDILDPAVAEGAWTWTWRSGGLAFTKRPRR